MYSKSFVLSGRSTTQQCPFGLIVFTTYSIIWADPLCAVEIVVAPCLRPSARWLFGNLPVVVVGCAKEAGEGGLFCNIAKGNVFVRE